MKLSQHPVGEIIRFIVFCCLILIALAQKASASPPLNTQNPNCFFNTVASRLLSSELNVNLSRLQIYPINAYTPAVNRLLQVTANIYDATTTNYYPSVFRPIFWKTNELICGELETNVYIVGYQYVQEPLTGNSQPIFYAPTDIAAANFPYGLSTTNNVYGIPWILGAKKGLPNFNALEIENCFFIERQLQFNRNSAAPSSGTFPYGRIYKTNQMYIMGVSNIFGAEFWNSYTSAYSNPVTILAQDSISVGLTNDAGISVANTSVNNAFYAINVWPGNSSTSAFILPFGTSIATLALSPNYPSPNNVYLYYYGPGTVTLSGVPFTGPCFIPTSLDSTNYLDAGTPPLPNFGMAVTNRLQAYILDSNDCILDYVQLGGMDNNLNVNEAIADPDNTGLWSTNYYDAGNTPFGVNEQYIVSSEGGAVPAEDSDGGSWANGPVQGTADRSPAAQQAFFTAFFTAADEAFDGENDTIISNTELSILAPFTPTRIVVQKMVYAANDPLVHYLASDLNDFSDDTNSRVLESPPLDHLGVISDRYMPWGVAGNLNSSILTDNNPNNLAYKDPLVRDSDDWNFPTNQSLNAAWLGQVHRGTPWQTIFLKSTNILELTETDLPLLTGFNTWMLWTGDTNLADAATMAPVQDWHVASFLASLFSTNYASLFSVNDANPNDWENLLNGLTVLTNTLSNAAAGTGFVPPQFAALVVSSNSAQAAVISSAIESLLMAQPELFFTNVGDIFAIPQLSDASPYLNTSSSGQIANGISDEAYEAIPTQLLPLLRLDSIGSIASTSGHTIIHFTGDDNHAYEVQVSSNLLTWASISTNCPFNGSFAVTNSGTANARYYRSILLQ